jgi:glycosyltransferase involved in cell wall biosynthesis
MLTGAARFIAVSDAERRQLEALTHAPGAVRVVPNPIDLDEFRRPIERGRFRRRFLLGDGPIVLFLGKLTPRKRVDVLMRAVRTLPPEVRLVVAGNDMGAGAALRALARELGIADRTLFTGLLEGTERLESLADADVVAYASEDEIFGLVAIEALLAGTPVVVADDSGCGEVVRHVGGGELVPVGDAAALAGALTSALAKRSHSCRVSTEVAARIRSLYGGDAVCVQLVRVYADVVRAA